MAFPIGDVIGSPARYTYRVCWDQAIPGTKQWWHADILPRVTTDRSIILLHGIRDEEVWGRPYVASIAALMTPAVLCVNMAYNNSIREHRFWLYYRVEPEEISTIQWKDLTVEEHTRLVKAVGREPLRSLVAGQNFDQLRGRTIYRYPAHTKKKG